jgi:hypothetical protein
MGTSERVPFCRGKIARDGSTGTNRKLLRFSSASAQYPFFFCVASSGRHFAQNPPLSLQAG